MESILWMDMLAYPQNLSDNLQSDKYTDMLAYPYLLEFSLNHNYLQSVLNFPQPRKYESNLSEKWTCPSPRIQNFKILQVPAWYQT